MTALRLFRFSGPTFTTKPSWINRMTRPSGTLKSFWISAGTLTFSWITAPDPVRNKVRVRRSARPRTLT